jgi:hypothetical protein
MMQAAVGVSPYDVMIATGGIGRHSPWRVHELA